MVLMHCVDTMLLIHCVNTMVLIHYVDMMILIHCADTMIETNDTMIVNSEVSTLDGSDLGTMIINDTEDEEDATMKSKFLLSH